MITSKQTIRHDYQLTWSKMQILRNTKRLNCTDIRAVDDEDVNSSTSSMCDERAGSNE